MLYIVSGHMRSGTSMMMQALEAGGMEAVYSKQRDQAMNARWGEAAYVPNDNYYELEAADYTAPDFPRKYEGKLIKCLIGGALRLPVGEYHVIVMRRPASEIAASLYAAFGSDLSYTGRTEDFDRQMQRYVEILRDRHSVKSLHEIWYGDIVASPQKELMRLDWPIDVSAAARIPTRDKARFVA
jgi:hypothetical protein